ncbi:sigma-70 family RNA polymerase sigma factor [Marinicella sp. W31]|uniref:sigma-70 family RNA polymerase sigma factor n=1 Tax=Marinicella sp. W31 TaxID=3023713 RepID=UPI00375834E9
MSALLHLKLLSATALGDRRAFEKQYRETSGQLLAVSLQLLKRKDLAEEALQEAFVSVWHNAAEYRQERGTVLTWMVSIVRYRALDILRGKKLGKESSDQSQPEVELEDPQNPESEWFKQRQRVKLDECMDHLDKPQANAISLAYFRGFSHTEVCQHMASPLGSVKSWIRRGLQLLKRCLEL